MAPIRHRIRLAPLSTAEVAADAVVMRLQKAGFTACRVGGAVRDRLLQRVPHEVDVATSAPPERVREVFARTFDVGASFGVVLVHGRDGIDTEVATFREDLDYADGRHPDGVVYATAGDDARRRDFTVNALFYDPVTAEVLDYVGGLADLRSGLVRAVGDPATRFREDHLRLMRAVRFTAELGFELDSATAAPIAELAPKVRTLSFERIQAELTKMLTGRDPAAAFEMLDRFGLLREVLPEVAAMRGVEQPEQYHPEGDVWVHTMGMLRLMRAPTAALAWGVLLHDVGKPPTLEWQDGVPRFPCHANVSGEMAEDILRRLKAPGWLWKQVREIVQCHMTFKDVPQMRASKLRRLLGRPTFADDLELHRLDCLGSHRMLDNYVFLLDKLAEFANEPVIPPPLLSGRDVLALGLAPGPEVGRILAEAQECQLNGQFSEREPALAWLRARIERGGPAEA